MAGGAGQAPPRTLDQEQGQVDDEKSTPLKAARVVNVDAAIVMEWEDDDDDDEKQETMVGLNCE